MCLMVDKLLLWTIVDIGASPGGSQVKNLPANAEDTGDTC